MSFWEEYTDYTVTHLKAELIQSNYQIDRVERESGLKLQHYEIADDYFRAGALLHISELSEDQPEDYQKYAFCEKGVLSYIRQVRTARSFMLTAHNSRQEALAEFEAAWQNTNLQDTEVTVRFGFYRAELAIPLRTIARNLILFCHGNIMSEAFELDRQRELLVARIAYSQYGLRLFEDIVDFVNWRLEDTAKALEEEKSLRSFHEHCTRFADWEQHTFL